MTLTHSLTHSLTHLLTHSLTYSLTYLLTRSLTHSLTHLLTYLLTGNSASAQFSMMVRYKNDSNIPLLVPSTPYSGTVSYHAMDYYYLRPTLDYNNIRLMVTTLQGDVDIYISSSWEERPYYFPGHGVASYKFSSTKIGDDEVVLTHDNILDLCPGTHSLTHSLTYSLTHSLTYSLTHRYKRILLLRGCNLWCL